MSQGPKYRTSWQHKWRVVALKVEDTNLLVPVCGTLLFDINILCLCLFDGISKPNNNNIVKFPCDKCAENDEKKFFSFSLGDYKFEFKFILNGARVSFEMFQNNSRNTNADNKTTFKRRIVSLRESFPRNTHTWISQDNLLNLLQIWVIVYVWATDRVRMAWVVITNPPSFCRWQKQQRVRHLSCTGRREQTPHRANVRNVLLKFQAECSPDITIFYLQKLLVLLLFQSSSGRWITTRKTSNLHY